MESFIVGLIIVAIVGAAVAYIVKEKKKGTRCIGCPMAGTCASGKKCSGSGDCGCSSYNDGCVSNNTED